MSQTDPLAIQAGRMSGRPMLQFAVSRQMQDEGLQMNAANAGRMAAIIDDLSKLTETECRRKAFPGAR
jgi:hypothetical protein